MLRLFLSVLCGVLFTVQYATAQIVISSGDTWRTNSGYVAGWNLPSFNDASWLMSSTPSPNVTPGYPTITGAPTMWNNPYSDTVYFRKEFYLKGDCFAAPWCEITADRYFELYINGNFVGSNANTGTIFNYNVQPHYKMGRNVIAIKAYNDSGPFLLAFKSEINYTSQPIIDLGGDTVVCIGESVTLGGQTYNGYSWSTGDFSKTITVDSAGTYFLRAQDQNNCNWVDSFYLYNYPVQIADLGQDIILCDGEKDTLDPGVFTNYVWSDGTGNPTLPIASEGIYKVTVTDNNQCRSTDEVSVSQFTSADIDLGPDTSICFGDQIVLNAAFPNSRFSWSTGERTQTITVIEAATYKVTVTNICGSRVGIKKVNYKTEVDLEIGEDTTFCNTDSVILLAPKGFNSFKWSTGSEADSIVVHEPGSYGLFVADQCGNAAYDEVEVTSKISPVNFLPNAFSPNIDGVNDTYGYEGMPVNNFELLILNRWGETVFETNDYNIKWDGNVKDRPQAAGIYTYRFSYRDCENQTIIKVGDIQLLR